VQLQLKKRSRREATGEKRAPLSTPHKGKDNLKESDSTRKGHLGQQTADEEKGRAGAKPREKKSQSNSDQATGEGNGLPVAIQVSRG